MIAAIWTGNAVLVWMAEVLENYTRFPLSILLELRNSQMACSASVI